jgi:glucose-1-phosphate thymidylyltransferase
MAGAHVENATVDRSVVFPNATITGSNVSDSIVDEETLVEDLDLSGSLVGAHSRLKPE